jgi:transcriptional regulator with XRE-family HTH domain
VLRARRGLSLTDAAKLAGIQRQTLAKLERGGTRPHDVTLGKLAKGYGIPVEDLLEEDLPGEDLPEEEILEIPLQDRLEAEDTFFRQLKHEFTVQSLLFAFDSLEWLGYRPSSNGDQFWIGDAEGNLMDKSSEEFDRFVEVVKGLHAMAPLAADAMFKRGTPGDAGIDAGGALLEAMDRWANR